MSLGDHLTVSVSFQILLPILRLYVQQVLFYFFTAKSISLTSILTDFPQLFSIQLCLTIPHTSSENIFHWYVLVLSFY